MNFTPNYKELKSSYIRDIGTTQTNVEIKLPANDSTNIMKVLCANAKCVPGTATFENGKLNYTGFVNFQVIYESDDNATYSLDYTAEYQDSYDVNDTDFYPQLACNVVTVDVQVINNEVKVIANVETDVKGIYTSVTQALADVNDETSFYESEDIKYQTFTGNIEDKFDYQHDFDIKDDVSRILSVCPMLNIDHVEVYDGYVKVNGGILVDINYFTTGDNAKVRTFQDFVTFEQEIAKEDIRRGDFVVSNGYIAINNLGITTTIDTDHTIVNLTMPIVYQGLVFSNQEATIVQDVFSTTNALMTTTSSFSTISDTFNEVFAERIDGSIRLDNMPFIDEILGTCCKNIALANAYIDGHELNVQGVAYTTVLYYSKEDNSTNSIVVEVPFQLTNSVDKMVNQNSIMLSLTDLSVKSKRGVEIEVFGKINVYANLYDEKQFAVISDVQVGEEFLNHGYALSVYFVKDGETLWDIAKETLVSPDQILEQNPDVTLPLKAGDRLYIYRQRNFNTRV